METKIANAAQTSKNHHHGAKRGELRIEKTRMMKYTMIIHARIDIDAKP
jgi:hypothetical protein